MASSGERPMIGRGRGIALSLIAAVAIQLIVASPAGAAPQLQSTGSSFAAGAISSWVKNASVLFGTDINFQVSSSVTGLSLFAQNSIDFGASDIPYSTNQSPYTPTVPYQYLPDVAGGLALMYNLTGSDGQRITNLNLNAEVTAQIFLGTITKWNDPRIAAINPQLQGGELPSTPVLAAYRQDGAGENYLLSDYLLHAAGGTFTAAQTAFGVPTTGPNAVGSPSATWPTPECIQYNSCGNTLNSYPAWGTSQIAGKSGADGVTNYVAGNNGAITYVETYYSITSGLPVANLYNSSGSYVQPSSVNVATALEQAILHQDLTQDLTNVYVSPQSNAYPLSSYSYFVTQCSPALAAAEPIANNSCGGGPPGASSNFPSDKGQELGQFVNYVACAGQDNLDKIGYSPLPPNLVQEDFYAIGRLNGGAEPPPPTPSNCKNPYVDGQTPLPGEPTIAGQPAPTPTAGGAVVGASAVAGATHGAGGTSSSGGTGGTTPGSSASLAATVAKLCQQKSGIAAQACTANGTLKSGYTVVDGQLARSLDTLPSKYLRSDALVAATSKVLGPGALALIGWVALFLLVVAGPPLFVTYRRRTRHPEEAIDVPE
jgi:phosphate transport system substrate-binding protein